MIKALIPILTILILTISSYGQTTNSLDQAQQDELSQVEGLALAPARFELVMQPGTEKTVVVNLIYNSASGEAQPTRLVANLADWSMLKNGKIKYYPAGTLPDSAAPWIIYSPTETTVIPNKPNWIRVTISVPSDARPGDHLAALFVEQRSDNIKLEENRGQMIVNFRLGAMFYIMVPPLSRRVSLDNLRANSDKEGITIVSTLKNEGNSRVRPFHSARIADSAGKIVAEIPECGVSVIPGGTEVDLLLQISKRLPPGTYTISYVMDARDGSGITEGQTTLLIMDNHAAKESPKELEEHGEQ